MAAKNSDLSNRITNWLAYGLLRGALTLPYRVRVPFMGWLMAWVIAPLAGYRRRVRTNLQNIFPDMPPRELTRLMRAVPNNMGRTLIEIYSGQQFKDKCHDIKIEGPGAAVLEAARDDKTPVLLITAHLGNYDALRANLVPRGFNISALFLRMKNPYFQKHYVRAISEFGPVYQRGRAGLAQTIRHIRAGGMMGLLVDVRIPAAATLTFFGKPALTATSAAEMSLKYDAPLVPIYALRQPDGLSFRLIAEAPITGTDPAEMTQALNDSLEAMIRKYPEQWFWVHRRWKPWFG